MIADVRPATRILAGVLLGAFAGFLGGDFMFGYKCDVGPVEVGYHCYPTQVLGIGFVTVAGLVIGLVASLLLLRFLAPDHHNTFLAVGTAILIIVGFITWSIRAGAWWNCADLCSPYVT